MCVCARVRGGVQGGLTVLLPFLLRRAEAWRGTTMRVITPRSSDNSNADRLRMTFLLRQFRIQADVVVLEGLGTPASADSIKEYDALGVPLAQQDEEEAERTMRQIRIGASACPSLSSSARAHE